MTVHLPDKHPDDAHDALKRAAERSGEDFKRLPARVDPEAFLDRDLNSEDYKRQLAELGERFNDLVGFVRQLGQREIPMPEHETTGVEGAFDQIESEIDKRQGDAFWGEIMSGPHLPELGVVPNEASWGDTDGGSVQLPEGGWAYFVVNPGHLVSNPSEEEPGMVSDSSGEFRVYLPTGEDMLGQNPKIKTPKDGALLYTFVGERAVALQTLIFPGDDPEAPEIHWGVAGADWVQGGGVGNTFPDLDFVTVFPAADMTGADPQVGAPVIVYLPSVSAVDPNVREGDILAYRFSAGEYFALSDHTDGKIGDIKIWTLRDGGDAPRDIPGGWFLADGNNGTDNLSGLFLPQYDAADADYNAFGATGGFKGHGGDVNDHADHEVPAHGHGTDTGGSTVTVTGDITTSGSGHGHAVTVQDGTDTIIADDSGTGTDLDVAPATHGHTATTSGSGGTHGHTNQSLSEGTPHTHTITEQGAVTLTHTETDNRPPYFTVFYIQRIN